MYTIDNEKEDYSPNFIIVLVVIDNRDSDLKRQSNTAARFTGSIT